ncbi:helix-turn-helix domain-containing protein [Caulobacter sp. FWC2]|uniref:helix-turn-helix domain-containing protein n=1 Tax=Caulobacter sp. FWC2 TaxID=69664 RepID=UPI000C14763A|nr:helix-turn-helix domain-containing protein [Caulobacter sp. FWC2]PIB94180.1 MerR family transcriptional regulator [Caulobacter sp. FWC2]
MFDIDISELARATGVRASTLRFYEEKGLIASTGRRGLKRLFSATVTERLSLIALGRASGFSLDEIAAMLGGPNPKVQDIDRTRLRGKAAELDRRIDQLTRMRDGLTHAADCKVPQLMDCPHFLRIVKVAGARRRYRAEAV